MTPELRAALSAHKAAILAALAVPAVPPADLHGEDLRLNGLTCPRYRHSPGVSPEFASRLSAEDLSDIAAGDIPLRTVQAYEQAAIAREAEDLREAFEERAGILEFVVPNQNRFFLPHLHPIGAIEVSLTDFPEIEALERLAGTGYEVGMAENSWETEKKRRGAGRPFPAGMSGNPGGRPRVVAEVRDLARRHTADAIAALVAIMQKGESEAARVSAANALLDRGYGKPTQVVDAEIGVRKLTDEQLTARIYELVQPKPLALLAERPTGTGEEVSGTDAGTSFGD